MVKWTEPRALACGEIESKLAVQIRRASEARIYDAYLIVRDNPEEFQAHTNPPKLPETLAEVSDNVLANWARDLLYSFSEKPERFIANEEDAGKIDPRESFGQLGTLLSEVGRHLSQAPRSLDTDRQINRIASAFSGTAMAHFLTSINGYSSHFGLMPSGRQLKSLSVHFHELKRCVVGSMRLLERDGMSRLAASKQVSKLVLKAGLDIKTDTIRKDWQNEIEYAEYRRCLDTTRIQEIPYRCDQSLLENWMDSNVSPQWSEHVRHLKSIGKVPLDLPNFAVQIKRDLVKSFIPNSIQRISSAWLLEQASVGESRR